MIRKDIIVCLVPLVLLLVVILGLYSNDVQKKILKDYSGCFIEEKSMNR